MSMSIRAKLLSAFGLNIVLIATLGIFALTQMGNMNKQAEALGQDALPSVVKANQISLALATYRITTYRHIANTDPAKKAEYEQQLGELEDQMGTLLSDFEALAESDTDRASYETIRSNWSTYVSFTHQNVLPISARGDQAAALNALQETVTLFDDKLVKSAQELVDTNVQEGNEEVDSVAATTATARNFVIGIAIIAVIVATVLGLFLSTAIARNVRLLTEATAA